MDSGLACFVCNITVLLLGLGTTMYLLVAFTPWPWWIHLAIFPPVFITWHLLVERVLSGLVNYLIEGRKR